MSRVLRLNTLLDRSFQPGATRLAAMRAELGRLDALCKTLGVRELSSFIDTTAVELQQAVELIDQEPRDVGAAEADPETGLIYGIEDMSWQPIAAGMTSLEALEQHLQRELQTNSPTPLVQELAYCIQTLAPMEAEGAQFHLALTPD
ncbi:MAG: hypothetical protein V7756_12525 [Halopseudomonas sp.]|uniref:hypothetical protein n=1 Tax=Halopseudomonas sp. TaxID=2901191 RepID=UPI0030034DCC